LIIRASIIVTNIYMLVTINLLVITKFGSIAYAAFENYVSQLKVVLQFVVKKQGRERRIVK